MNICINFITRFTFYLSWRLPKILFEFGSFFILCAILKSINPTNLLYLAGYALSGKEKAVLSLKQSLVPT